MAWKVWKGWVFRQAGAFKLGKAEERSGTKRGTSAAASSVRTYLFEVLQLSEIFVTFETVNDCCEELELVGAEELVELLGVDELLVPLGLVLAEADTAIGVPLRRTCWLTCWASSSVEPVSW
jgi:hypothetical protein